MAFACGPRSIANASPQAFDQIPDERDGLLEFFGGFGRLHAKSLRGSDPRASSFSQVVSKYLGAGCIRALGSLPHAISENYTGSMTSQKGQAFGAIAITAMSATDHTF